MASLSRIEIVSRSARAVIRPHLGAGLERYDFLGRGNVEPLFRPASPEAQRPFQLANIPLVPWSGRISGGGFTFRGSFHALEPNVPGEPLPLHGGGFSSEWAVVQAGRSYAKFSLQANGPAPFRYDALVSYRLDEQGALTMELAVTNRAPIPLPYGGGFHPWFPRGQDTRLTARARIVWLEDEHHLPASSEPVHPGSKWDFSTGKVLPGGWLHAWFSEWDGNAAIEWPDRHLALTVDASTALSSAVLYSPSEDAGFFCFEPVSHPVDAHNLEEPEDFGLTVLNPGETFNCAARFIPSAI